MYLCYLDESGHCGNKYNKLQPVEVICGILTDVSKLFKTQKQHHQIIELLNERGIPLSELKATDTYRGRKSWSGVEPSVRDKIFEDIIGWAESRKCKYLVCPIDSKKFFDNKAKGCKICNTFCYPYEAGAFNAVLAIQRLQKSKKKNKGKTQVIFDEQAKHDINLLNLFDQDLGYTDEYTGYVTKALSKNQIQRFNQIVDVPHFSKSHQSVLIQLADWIAFIVNRYLLLKVYKSVEKYKGELNKIIKWYNRIGNNLIAHTAIDPPGKGSLCAFYRNIRPNGWTAKAWKI